MMRAFGLAQRWCDRAACISLLALNAIHRKDEPGQPLAQGDAPITPALLSERSRPPSPYCITCIRPLGEENLV